MEELKNELEELKQKLSKSEARKQEAISNYELLKSKIVEKDREISSIKREFTNYKKDTRQIMINQDETIRLLQEKLNEK